MLFVMFNLSLCFLYKKACENKEYLLVNVCEKWTVVELSNVIETHENEYFASCPCNWPYGYLFRSLEMPCDWNKTAAWVQYVKLGSTSLQMYKERDMSFKLSNCKLHLTNIRKVYLCNAGECVRYITDIHDLKLIYLKWMYFIRWICWYTNI